jgi:hypothetical protein
MCTFIYLYEKHKNIKIIFIYSPLYYSYTGKKLGIRVFMYYLIVSHTVLLAVEYRHEQCACFFVYLYPYIPRL